MVSTGVLYSFNQSACGANDRISVFIVRSWRFISVDTASYMSVDIVPCSSSATAVNLEENATLVGCNGYCDLHLQLVFYTCLLIISHLRPLLNDVWFDDGSRQANWRGCKIGVEGS